MRAIALPIIVGALLAAESAARPCSHPSFPGSPYLGGPEDGATAVPTNAVITVHWAMWSPPESDVFRVRSPDGSDVAATVERVGSWGTTEIATSTFRIAPAAELAPTTTYEVEWFDGTVVESVGSFTTGGGRDDEAPAAPAIEEVILGERHPCGDEDEPFGCCGPFPLVRAQLRLAPAEPLLFTIREGDVLLAIDRAPPLDGYLFCSGFFSFRDEVWGASGPAPAWWAIGGVHEIVVRARDLAGNTSPERYVTLVADCRVEDEGSAPLPPAKESDGCRITARTRGAGGAVIVAIAVLVALRRRRR